MTISTEKSRPDTAQWPVKASSHISALLADQAREQRTDSDYYRHALALLAGWVDAPLALLDVRVGAQTLELKYESEATSAEAVAGLLGSMPQEAAAGDAPAVIGPDGSGLLLVKAPLHHPQLGPIGTLLTAVAAQDRTPNQWLRDIQSLAALVVSLRAAVRPPAKSGNLQAVLQRAAEFETVGEFADSIVIRLAKRLQCRRVSLGVVDGRHVRVVSVSDGDWSDDEICRLQLRRAMQECAAAGRSMACQPAARGDARDAGQPEHQKFQEHAGGSVLSAPLSLGDQVTAVVTFQRDAADPFEAGDVEWIESQNLSFAPAIHLLKRSETGPLPAVQRTLKATRQVLESRRFWIFAGVLLVLSVLFAAAVSRHSENVSFVAKLMPGQIDTIAVPMQGQLAELLVKPGDEVVEGQTIAKLDDTQLKARRQRLRGQRLKKIQESRALLEKRHTDLAALALAEAEVIVGDLASLQERIEACIISATASGTVLRRRAEIGAEIDKDDALVDLASGSNYAVIPEKYAGTIKPGMSLNFRPRGRKAIDCEISRVRSFNADGQLQLRAEFDSLPPAEEVGSFHMYVDERPLWWLTIRQIVEWTSS